MRIVIAGVSVLAVVVVSLFGGTSVLADEAGCYDSWQACHEAVYHGSYSWLERQLKYGECFAEYIGCIRALMQQA